ncbi:hypothetical protein LSTR_LSTR006741, partial [Laodelphax striatellus]
MAQSKMYVKAEKIIHRTRTESDSCNHGQPIRTMPSRDNKIVLHSSTPTIRLPDVYMLIPSNIILNSGRTSRLLSIHL